MRLFFIVDDTLFFLPQWMNKVISGLDKKDCVVGITPLTSGKGHPTIYSYLARNILKVGAQSIIKIGMVLVLLKLKQLAFSITIYQEPISVHQVAQKHKTRIIPTDNVNSPAYLKRIVRLKPDIVVSSCSQIFKEDLLHLPKIACINRHSALLPSYSGLFPIFRAMINKEKLIGATVHYMVKKIDQGKIIYQKSFTVKKKGSLFFLYQKAYQESVEVTLQAINVIRKRTKPVIIKGNKPSYYSFPTEQDWEIFFKEGNRFI